MAKKPSSALQVVPAEFVERKIYLIRGQKVMFDSDLAELYQVPTKALNQAVRRNLKRFPVDFMFQLNAEELGNWRSQIAASNNPGAKMGLRRPPYAFTEHGVAMLSSVLNSAHAIAVNIAIMRTFVRLRDYVAAHKDLARKMEDFQRTQQEHGVDIQQIYGHLEQLLEPVPEFPKRRFGFAPPKI
jgi:ORF6N domain